MCSSNRPWSIASSAASTVSPSRGGAPARASQAEDLMGKQLELFAQVLGKPATVAVVSDGNSTVHPRMFSKLVSIAQKLKLDLVKVESGGRPGKVPLSDAFEIAARQKAGAVFVLADESFFFSRRAEIVALAARYLLPAFYGMREFVDAGGLMSCGENLNTVFRSVAAGRSTARLGKRATLDLGRNQATRLEGFERALHQHLRRVELAHQLAAQTPRARVLAKVLRIAPNAPASSAARISRTRFKK